jgi:DNA-binding winged helix-turn-helix (wHTH) protein/tetratricopeptide (TPR) repeat protein
MSVEQASRRAGTLSFGAFTIDLGDERLIGPAGPVKLGNKAYRLLLQLLEQDGRLVTKEDLFSTVWDGTIVSEAALTSAVKELRRALGDDTKTPTFIESVYGRGYRFLAPVTRGSETPAAPAQAQPRVPAPTAEGGDPPLLYIPPLDDEAVRGGHPHLGTVLREEILFALSRFRDIRLVSDSEPSAPAAGHGERDYQLDIRLLQLGSTIRVFARISRLSSQEIIWADTMSLPEDTVGQAAEQTVRRIAAAALPRLHDDVLRHLPEQPSGVHDLYFVNRLRMRSLDSIREARALAESWEALIEQHPAFLQAYPPLIRLYNTDFAFTGIGASGPGERRRAYELARRAVTIDPTESHLHTTKGWCHLWAGEWALARAHVGEALQLNPYNKARLLEAATAYMFLDELDAAADLLERCRNLTSFATEAPYEEEGLLLLLQSDYRGAAERLALATRNHPDDAAAGGPTVLSDLYALLAAGALQSPDLAQRSARWQAAMRERWAGDQAPEAERLIAWALFHNPFQSERQRERLVRNLNRALEAAPRAGSPAPGQGRAETRS